MNRLNRRLFGVLALLVLIAAFLPLGSFLAGVLSGGGRLADPSRPQHTERGPGTLRVTVLSALDSAPIEGARILVRGLASGEADLKTDPGGHATITGFAAGPVHVLASHGESLAAAWTDPTLEDEILLAVAPEEGRRGEVRYEDGSPAAARVRLLDADGAEIESTRTDDQGRYELPDDPEGASICVEPLRGAPAVALRGDVAVPAGVEHAGHLLGAGEGELRIFGWVTAQDDDLTLLFRADWKVDAEGGFRGHLPDGARAWGIFDGLPLRIVKGDIELPGRVRAKGVVQHLDGSPAPDAVLLFRPLLDDDVSTPLPGLRIEADKLGRFDATGFADERYSVEVRAPGCAARIIEDVRVGKEPLTVKLEPGYAAGGFVVDGQGLPVPHAEVRAACFPEAQGERPLAFATADAKGRFFFDGLGGEYCRIQVRAGGYHPTTLDTQPEARELRVTLQKR